MSTNLQHMKQAEERVKASFYSAIQSSLVLALVMLAALAFGIVLALS